MHSSIAMTQRLNEFLCILQFVFDFEDVSFNISNFKHIFRPVPTDHFWKNFSELFCNIWRLFLTKKTQVSEKMTNSCVLKQNYSLCVSFTNIIYTKTLSTVTNFNSKTQIFRAFSKLDENENFFGKIYISDVVHKIYVNIFRFLWQTFEISACL